MGSKSSLPLRFAGTVFETFPYLLPNLIYGSLAVAAPERRDLAVRFRPSFLTEASDGNTPISRGKNSRRKNPRVESFEVSPLHGEFHTRLRTGIGSSRAPRFPHDDFASWAQTSATVEPRTRSGAECRGTRVAPVHSRASTAETSAHPCRMLLIEVTRLDDLAEVRNRKCETQQMPT